MRKLTLLSFFICARFLSAQTQVMMTPTPVGEDQASVAFRQMDLFRHAIATANDERANHTAEKRAEQYARIQFWQKANHFVSLWENFAAQLNENQTFDAKLAKKLSKAFHELETSDGWPVRALPPGKSEETK